MPLLIFVFCYLREKFTSQSCCYSLQLKKKNPHRTVWLYTQMTGAWEHSYKYNQRWRQWKEIKIEPGENELPQHKARQWQKKKKLKRVAEWDDAKLVEKKWQPEAADRMKEQRNRQGDYPHMPVVNHDTEKGHALLSISALRGRQYMHLSSCAHTVCVCWNSTTVCRHSSLNLHISRATPSLLPCPRVSGYYIKCPWQSKCPSQAPAVDEFLYKKLHCQHEKVMEKTTACSASANTEGAQMTTWSHSQVIKYQSFVKPTGVS